MHRRTVLASLGGLPPLASAGCLGDGGDGGDGAGPQPDDARPEACPVDTVEDVEPPTELDRDTVESFLEQYEPAYVDQTRIDREQYDRIEDPGTSIVDVTHVDEGYRVTVETFWATWEPDRTVLGFELVTDAATDPVPWDHETFEDNPTLQEALEQAATGDRTADIPEKHPDYRRTRDQLEAAAGDVDGVVIDYQGDLIRVSESELPGVHGDHYLSAAYYVAPGVIYRTDDEDADPRNGTVLEC
ncbi:hypothetical protein AArcSl_2933 [Halalkaliarchaeum desulfuricum]|uniref:Lipoprotein n=1 Tax=Halalkaliarchaeum desulfuricum TaxID=2055893 RepID=A0A343TN72_9EURY|nr:hypothetical protein [Halalkaliarchaeum desulfuricum]AUX10544.1 hypothetical protein AArcSl_2933 [Halalkaliarchaeum desulfuricum]